MAERKTFLAKHAKSSAALVSIGIHAAIILVAVSFVAVTVIQKDEQQFKAQTVKRPQMKLKKLQVPVKIQKPKPKPKMRKRLVVKKVDLKVPDIKMPEITGVKGGSVAAGGPGGGYSIGFTMPEIDFFGAKAKGEKVVFVVHFGPATSGTTPYPRMTSYTIRKRLEEMVMDLPEYTLFNVTAYWWNLCTPFSDKMLLATPKHKRLLMDWMEPVNSVEGSTKTYGSDFERGFNQRLSNLTWPKRLDKKIPSYGPKWYYDYRVSKEIDDKYLPAPKQKFTHWSRALTWAIQTQKPDTVFILTTNYISPPPDTIVDAYRKMCRDVYGPDRKQYPTVNVVVLANAGKDGQKAKNVLNNQFGPVILFFRGDGSVILDIKNHMNDEEKERLAAYAKREDEAKAALAATNSSKKKKK